MTVEELNQVYNTANMAQRGEGGLLDIMDTDLIDALNGLLTRRQTKFFGDAHYLEAGEWGSAQAGFFDELDPGATKAKIEVAGMEYGLYSADDVAAVTGRFTFTGALDDDWKSPTDAYVTPHIELTADFDQDIVFARTFDDPGQYRWRSGDAKITTAGTFNSFGTKTPENMADFDHTGFSGAFYDDGDTGIASGTVIAPELFGTFTTAAGVDSP